MGLLSFFTPESKRMSAAVMAAATAATVSAASVDTQTTTTTGPRRKAKSKAGTAIHAGKITDRDFNAEVRGPQWYGQPGTTGIAAKMMTDTMVAQSVEYVVSVVTSGDWYFKPASESPLDIEIADYMTMSFLERRVLALVIRSWMMGYMANGFHLVEPLEGFAPVSADRFPNHKGGGVGVVPTEFVDVPAWTVDQFHQSKRNSRDMHRITQYVVGSDGEKAGYVDISANRLMRMTWDQEGADYTGNAILRRIYGAWKIKQVLLVIDSIKHERMGAGTPSFGYSEGATDKDLDDAIATLEELRVNEKGFFLLPPEWKFDWNTISKSDGSDIAAAIARCDIYIAQNSGAGYMLLGLQNQAGSYALSGTQQGQHHLQAQGHVRFLVDAINFGQDGWSLLRRLTTLNYGADASCPTLLCRNLPTKPVFETVKAYTSGVQAGSITRDDRIENEAREMLDLSPIDHETASAVNTSTQAPPATEGAEV
jgi:hypothetical protein